MLPNWAQHDSSFTPQLVPFTVLERDLEIDGLNRLWDHEMAGCNKASKHDNKSDRESLKTTKR